MLIEILKSDDYVFEKMKSAWGSTSFVDKFNTLLDVINIASENEEMLLRSIAMLKLAIKDPDEDLRLVAADVLEELTN